MEIHNKFYSIYLKRLFDRIEEGIEIGNKENKTKAAYLFLLIRDTYNPIGNVDVISNVTTPAMVTILESALESAKRKIEDENKNN